jgi:hypothetical protein
MDRSRGNDIGRLKEVGKQDRRATIEKEKREGI